MIVAGRWKDLVYSKKEWGQQMDMNRAERKKDQVNMCDGERETETETTWPSGLLFVFLDPVCQESPLPPDFLTT